MSKSADTKTTFKFLVAYLLVIRVQPKPAILEAQENALEKGALARYNMTRVDLKTFTFSAGSKSRSIDNAVLGPLPKRLLFTMIKNTDFNGSVDTNPYKFGHYDISEFSLYVNGRRVQSEGLSLDMDHEKTSVMGFRALFEGSGIHHSNTGLQITHDMYINGFFMLLFDLPLIMRRLRLIHHSLRMEISGSNYSLVDLCRSPSLACCTSNTTVLS
jgi:hypothetical protein